MPDSIQQHPPRPHAAGQNPKQRKHWTQKLCLLLLKTVGLLVFLLTVSLGGLFLVCEYKSNTVISIVQSLLNEETGLYWYLGEVRPSLLPAPGVRFNAINVYEERREKPGASPAFTAQYLIIEPDIFQLVANGGRIAFRRIILDSPAFSLQDSPTGASLVSAEALPHEDSTATASSATASQPAPEQPVPEQAQEAELESATAESALAGESDTEAALSGSGPTHSEAIQAALREAKQYLRPKHRTRIARATITHGSLRLADANGVVYLKVNDFLVDVRTAIEKESVMQGRVSFPVVGVEASASLGLTLHGRSKAELASMWLKASTEVVLPESEKSVTGDLTLEASWLWEGDRIQVQNLALDTEGDVLHASLVFDPKTATLSGPVDFASFSLPRWFFFARNLPPGLQERLHVLSGSMQLAATPANAYATEVKAQAGDLTITGSLGVDDYRNPVIKVDLDMDYADLDKIFPFLATNDTDWPDPVEPEFSHVHLIPFPGPGGEDAPDVWYDVTVRTRNITAHALEAGPLVVTVLPRGESHTRVSLDARDMAEGTIKGYLDISRKTVGMQFDLDKVSLDMLPENRGSSVVFGGLATGRVDLSVPVKDGSWADDWGITFSGFLNKHTLTLTGTGGWGFLANKVDLKGKGVVHTLRSKGLQLEGTWDIGASGLSSTWYTKGNDTLNGTLQGTIAWPAKKPRKPGDPREPGGLYRVYGNLAANGSVVLPLGDRMIPLKGSLRSPLEWQVQKGILDLKGYTFTGFDSTVNGNLTLDSSKDKTSLTTTTKYTLAPRVILGAWGMLTDAVQMPAKMQGTGELAATDAQTVFSKLNFMADDAPVTGKVTVTQAAARKEERRGSKENVLWDIDLKAKSINLDNYLVPPKPEDKYKPASKEPWSFSFLTGMDIQAKMLWEKASFRGFNANQTDLSFRLSKGQLSLTSLTANMYTGRATVQLRGILDAAASTIALERGYLMLKAISLSALATEVGSTSQYAGMADMVFDVAGKMGNPSDFPGALSGQWSIEVRDGLFPAFLGNDSAGLRNSFSRAALSGTMKNGVLASEDFVLTGSMVEIGGGGWMDLNQSKLQMDMSVTLAGLPTVPVKFAGRFDSMGMSMGGSNALVATVSATGSTIFNLIQGVIELPARAILGIGSLFDSKKEVVGKTYEPTTPPRQPGERPRRR